MEQRASSHFTTTILLSEIIRRNYNEKSFGCIAISNNVVFSFISSVC